MEMNTNYKLPLSYTLTYGQRRVGLTKQLRQVNNFVSELRLFGQTDMLIAV